MPILYPELKTTADGSSTLFVEEFDEHYHSVHGAVQESMHVFINAGLVEKAKSKNNIAILEMGFGTGLNALLTIDFAMQNNTKVDYHTIEKFPIEENVYTQLYNSDNNYKHSSFFEMHQAKHEQTLHINNNFTFKKYITDIHQFQTTNKFDIIYYDAFAPSAQADLWTVEIFEKIFAILNDDGFLVTYCAKGSVKRNLKTAGFNVIALPGPKGKREMTKAIKL